MEKLELDLFLISLARVVELTPLTAAIGVTQPKEGSDLANTLPAVLETRGMHFHLTPEFALLKYASRLP